MRTFPGLALVAGETRIVLTFREVSVLYYLSRWRRAIPELTSVGWSAFCDLVLALYPVAFFWKVQLKLSVKAGLCCLMGLGIM